MIETRENLTHNLSAQKQDNIEIRSPECSCIVAYLDSIK
jgi:hypothetical protein